MQNCGLAGWLDSLEMTAKAQKVPDENCFFFILIHAKKNECCEVRAEHIHPWMFLSSDWGESLLHMGSAGVQNGKASCDCNRWAHGRQFRAQLALTLLESWGDTARWKCAIFVLCSVFGPNCCEKVQMKCFLHGSCLCCLGHCKNHTLAPKNV